MLFWDTEMFVKSPQPPGSITSKATATASSLEKRKLKECKNIIPSQGFLNHFSLFYLTPGVIVNVKNRSGSSKIHEFHDVELKMLKNKRHSQSRIQWWSTKKSMIWDVFKCLILTTSMLKTAQLQGQLERQSQSYPFATAMKVQLKPKWRIMTNQNCWLQYHYNLKSKS